MGTSKSEIKGSTLCPLCEKGNKEYSCLPLFRGAVEVRFLSGSEKRVKG